METSRNGFKFLSKCTVFKDLIPFGKPFHSSGGRITERRRTVSAVNTGPVSNNFEGYTRVHVNSLKIGEIRRLACEFDIENKSSYFEHGICSIWQPVQLGKYGSIQRRR